MYEKRKKRKEGKMKKRPEEEESIIEAQLKTLPGAETMEMKIKLWLASLLANADMQPGRHSDEKILLPLPPRWQEVTWSWRWNHDLTSASEEDEEESIHVQSSRLQPVGVGSTCVCVFVRGGQAAVSVSECKQ